MPDDHFLKMIQTLREKEEVMLYGNVLHVNEQQSNVTVAFLQREYEKESLNYPYQSPAFDAAAALWGAKTIYLAAQLMLYRENKEADLPALFPVYTGAVTPAAVVSADLCLRFLPDLVTHLKLIDSEDGLIAVLEGILNTWHYSGVSYALDADELDFSIVLTDKCLEQLYVNRVIGYKRMPLAKHPMLKDLVKASMSIYVQDYWNNFKIEMTTNE